MSKAPNHWQKELFRGEHGFNHGSAKKSDEKIVYRCACSGGTMRRSRYSNSGVSSISGTNTSPLSVIRISGITDSGIRLNPM